MIRVAAFVGAVLGATAAALVWAAATREVPPLPNSWKPGEGTGGRLV